MSDARLRELERRAAAGDLPARAEWLLARRRAGRLGEGALELLAWAGEPAARLALGAAAPGPAPGEVGAFALELGRFGPRACVTAGTGAAEAALALAPGPGVTALEPGLVGGLLAGARAALEAARAWVAAPGPDRAAASGAAAIELSGLAAEGSEGFWTLVDADEARGLRAELVREVSPPNQAPLRDMLPFARGGNGDDVAGVVLREGEPLATVCTVHLTWVRGPEQPGWPSLRLHPDPERFVGDALLGPLADEDDLLAARGYAAAFPAAPALLETAPAANAALALACAARVLGAERARTAALQALVAWGLASDQP